MRSRVGGPAATVLRSQMRSPRSPPPRREHAAGSRGPARSSLLMPSSREGPSLHRRLFPEQRAGAAAQTDSAAQARPMEAPRCHYHRRTPLRMRSLRRERRRRDLPHQGDASLLRRSGHRRGSASASPQRSRLSEVVAEAIATGPGRRQTTYIRLAGSPFLVCCSPSASGQAP
jgi:hypothetical protein